MAKAKKKVPTQAEVEAEIKKLKEMKPKVRETSYFGDNHHDAIDAQIEALEDDLDTDDCYDREENGDWAENVRSAAVDAIDWRDGDKDEQPSLEWKDLIIA